MTITQCPGWRITEALQTRRGTTRLMTRRRPCGETSLAETVFTDVSAPTSTTWLMKLDIFGNVTQRQLACCNVQTTTFTDNNGYALAESVTKGASGGPQLTSSATYDFNTSADSTTTDPNGLVTTVNTRDAALRPTLITFPTTATASATYNDNTPSVSQSVSYDDGGTQKTVTQLNGV